MLLKQFIQADKVISGAGTWSDKKLAKNPSKFPLWKPKGVRLGSAFRWRIVEFWLNDGSGTKRVGRMLVAFRRDKQEYLAYVGVDELIGGGTLVLARLEFHGTHDGLHVHSTCEPPEAACVGRMNHGSMRRLPNGGKYHRRSSFVIDDDEAIRIAAEFFNFKGLTPSNDQGKLEFWK